MHVLRIFFYAFFSSRRGRPPKQGPTGLSAYEDFADDESIQAAKKYRIDDKESNQNDLNCKFNMNTIPLATSIISPFEMFCFIPTPLSIAKAKYLPDYGSSAIHLNHMQLMQMNQHRLAQSIANSEMSAHHIQRSGEENSIRNANIHRQNLWENCSASYESFVKNLER